MSDTEEPNNDAPTGPHQTPGPMAEGVDEVPAYRTHEMEPILVERNGERQIAQIVTREGVSYAEVMGSYPFAVQLTDNDTEYLASKYPRAEGDDDVHYSPDVRYEGKTNTFHAGGVVYAAVKESNPQPPLKSYKIGEHVEVLRGGDFVPGVITSIQAGSVNVDTERGPVPVGGPLRIRKIV